MYVPYIIQILLNEYKHNNNNNNNNNDNNNNNNNCNNNNTYFKLMNVAKCHRFRYKRVFENGPEKICNRS